MDTGQSISFTSLRQVNDRLFSHSVHLSRCTRWYHPRHRLRRGLRHYNLLARRLRRACTQERGHSQGGGDSAVRRAVHALLLLSLLAWHRGLQRNGQRGGAPLRKASICSKNAHVEDKCTVRIKGLIRCPTPPFPPITSNERAPDARSES
jgi:hypothetical protein